MIQKEQIQELFQQYIVNKSVFIVDISVQPGNKIKLFIDSLKGVTIDECAEISRILTEKINEFEENFEIEVSSPGLSSYFKVSQQYFKNIGKQVEILRKDGIKIIGTLVTYTDENLSIEEEKKIIPEGKKKKELVKITHTIKHLEIKSAKLHLTF